MTDDRYSRQTMLAGFGEAGQRRLAEAKVLVVGVGGLGSAASLYLAGAGVGTIALLDPDTVSLSNLQRQVLYSESQVGQSKVDMAAARLHALNSAINIRISDEALTADNARETVRGFDLVLDCTDNFAARYIIDDACAYGKVPWIYGSVGEFSGQVAFFNSRAGVRFTDLYPGREELSTRHSAVTGVLGAVTGVIGAVQAAEAVKFLVGMGHTAGGRLFSIDLLTMQSQILDI